MQVVIVSDVATMSSNILSPKGNDRISHRQMHGLAPALDQVHARQPAEFQFIQTFCADTISLANKHINCAKVVVVSPSTWLLAGLLASFPNKCGSPLRRLA